MIEVIRPDSGNGMISRQSSCVDGVTNTRTHITKAIEIAPDDLSSF